jgi:hypothetical protein
MCTHSELDEGEGDHAAMGDAGFGLRIERVLCVGTIEEWIDDVGGFEALLAFLHSVVVSLAWEA